MDDQPLLLVMANGQHTVSLFKIQMLKKAHAK